MTADSARHSSSSSMPAASLHPRRHQSPHPIRLRSHPTARPTLPTSPQNSFPPLPASRESHSSASQLRARPLPGSRAIHPAIHSTQKLLPAIPAEPAAYARLLYAFPNAPASIPLDSTVRATRGTRHSIPKKAPKKFRAPFPSRERNYPDAASNSVDEIASQVPLYQSAISAAIQKL